jgi:hypothetical protein
MRPASVFSCTKSHTVRDVVRTGSKSMPVTRSLGAASDAREGEERSAERATQRQKLSTTQHRRAL